MLELFDNSSVTVMSDQLHGPTCRYPQIVDLNLAARDWFLKNFLLTACIMANSYPFEM